ncbi:hypothetical protein Zmor_008456 [Zophobas morio]|uniref:Uncharacterized protein n=1 Tax=Zophobas morio TaxID=2755281 RepID=A0AA38J495_9CUCU|nr:hypothetical protein Zmor_008456 [Zophobas morio]
MKTMSASELNYLRVLMEAITCRGTQRSAVEAQTADAVGFETHEGYEVGDDEGCNFGTPVLFFRVFEAEPREFLQNLACFRQKIIIIITFIF